MTAKHIEKILTMHGIIFDTIGIVGMTDIIQFNCYCYSNSDDYDIILTKDSTEETTLLSYSQIENNIIANNEIWQKINKRDLFNWLGY